jgi:hypothetical protein
MLPDNEVRANKSIIPGTSLPGGIGIAVPDPEVCMKPLTWHGKSDIPCESVPDPRIEDSRDVATVTIGVTDSGPSPPR